MGENPLCLCRGGLSINDLHKKMCATFWENRLKIVYKSLYKNIGKKQIKKCRPKISKLPNKSVQLFFVETKW